MAPALDLIETMAKAQSLEVLGLVEGSQPGPRSIVLLGPHEPGFWSHVKTSPEFSDRRPDPVDRWSQRVIGKLANDLSARAVFPFGEPPYHPFIDWALASGRCWRSPATLLVHERQGMWVSFRGALAFDEAITAPAPSGKPPCDSCRAAPCKTACPVGALTAGGYDALACKAHVASDAGRECREGGCLARRACPVSQTYGRSAEQSAHHMEYFL